MINSILGIKLGQTQQFTDDGRRIAVTKIAAGPCWISGITDMGDYRNIEIAFGSRKRLSQAQTGHLKKAGLDKKPRFFRTVRVTDAADLKAGQEIKISEVLTTNDAVSVTGTSKGKGFAGVSTRVLEDKRKDASKKSFALGYNDCYVKVKDILNIKDKESYIYAEDPKKKMIAIYLSSADTTPVGIFFTEGTGANTLIEISSPSIYAKEEIASRIFTGIDTLLNPKPKPNTQNQMEKKTDVKEKVINQ